jgi:hypothetical protein
MTSPALRIFRQERQSEADARPHRLADLPAGVLPLAGDKVAVLDAERTETARLHVVRTATPELVLDPPRHNAPPYEGVGIVFFDVRKAGNGLPVDQVGAIRQLQVDECSHAVTEQRRHLTRFVERADRVLKTGVVSEREHWREPAAHDECIILGEIKRPQGVFVNSAEHVGDFKNPSETKSSCDQREASLGSLSASTCTSPPSGLATVTS